MINKFKCKCGASLKAADELAGRKGKCPRCGKVFIVPSPNGAESPDVERSSHSQCAACGKVLMEDEATQREGKTFCRQCLPDQATKTSSKRVTESTTAIPAPPAGEVIAQSLMLLACVMISVSFGLGFSMDLGLTNLVPRDLPIAVSRVNSAISKMQRELASDDLDPDKRSDMEGTLRELQQGKSVLKAFLNLRKYVVKPTGWLGFFLLVAAVFVTRRVRRLSGGSSDNSTENLEFAGIIRRIEAAIVDGFILLPAVGLLFFISVQIAPHVNIYVVYFLSWNMVVVIWLYRATMESSQYQATLGKIAQGLSVVNDRGERISFLQASVREFARVFSLMTVFIGYLMPIWTKRRQALHDKAAGTLVIITGERRSLRPW